MNNVTADVLLNLNFANLNYFIANLLLCVPVTEFQLWIIRGLCVEDSMVAWFWFTAYIFIHHKKQHTGKKRKKETIMALSNFNSSLASKKLTACWIKYLKFRGRANSQQCMWV